MSVQFFEKIHEEIHHAQLTLFHEFAMFVPNIQLKRAFYRLRGTKIGKNVDIANFVFLEDCFPELITIRDNVDIGPNVIVVTHDSSKRCILAKDTLEKAPVVIENNAYIGAGAIILPGVTIGEHSIVGAGAVVTQDIPPFCVALGMPAKVYCTIDQWAKGDTGS